jgi:hypothetical protein
MQQFHQGNGLGGGGEGDAANLSAAVEAMGLGGGPPAMMQGNVGGGRDAAFRHGQQQGGPGGAMPGGGGGGGGGGGRPMLDLPMGRLPVVSGNGGVMPIPGRMRCTRDSSLFF